MRFTDSQIKEIKMYILENISQNAAEISKSVSETFSINQNTVHKYINELAAEGIITRIKRGQYALVTRTHEYDLSRQNGDLRTDTYAYEHYLLPHMTDLRTDTLSIWDYVICEMLNNVMDHSSAEHFKLILEQNYLTTRLYIIDNGVGIFDKIKNHFDFASLDEAICELFKGKLTTDSDNHSGEGIFFSSKLMDDFFIISGGKIFTSNKYDDSLILSLASAPASGTTVIMSLSNYTHKKAKEVFDMYSNDDGEFIKTRLPLKNIFAASPVSRSQANRICSRLEKFKEVTLDFDELQWMGQGFAHQLFVVFAKKHPEINLQPINMNEDVAKMYHHVMASS